MRTYKRLVLTILISLLSTAANADTNHHLHSSHAHGLLEVSPPLPMLSIQVTRDAMQGWNLQLLTDNFVFAPRNASGPHIPGEGHAHLYIDGEKQARLYGHWYHIPALGKGQHEIRVSLNSNDHQVLAHQGQPIETVFILNVE